MSSECRQSFFAYFLNYYNWLFTTWFVWNYSPDWRLKRCVWFSRHISLFLYSPHLSPPTSQGKIQWALDTGSKNAEISRNYTGWWNPPARQWYNIGPHTTIPEITLIPGAGARSTDPAKLYILSVGQRTREEKGKGKKLPALPQGAAQG